MKQKGNQWIGPDGSPTAYKYVPHYERMAENIGQKLAAIAVSTEKLQVESRLQFVRLCDEMLARYKANNPNANVKSFSFTTFDKEFRVEVTLQEKKNLYRVYQATKANPKFNEYRLVNMDFSGISEGTVNLDASAGKDVFVITDKSTEAPLFKEEENLVP